MAPGLAAAEANEPAQPVRVMQIGGTTIKIMAPKPMTDAEKAAHRQAVVKAVARCILAQQK